MSISSVEQVYQQYIKPLSIRERLKLVALISQELSGLASDYPSATEIVIEKIENEIEIKEQSTPANEKEKGAPQTILQLAGSLSPEEAAVILQASQETRQIDWDMWE